MSAATLIRIAAAGLAVAGSAVVVKKTIAKLNSKHKNPCDESLLASRVVIDAAVLNISSRAIECEKNVVDGLVTATGNRSSDCGKAWIATANRAKEVIAAGGQATFSIYAPVWSDFDKRTTHQVKLYDIDGNTVAEATWVRNAYSVKN